MKTLATYPWGTIILSAVGSFIASTVWYMLLVGNTDPAVHWITIPVILVAYAMQATVLFAVLNALGAKGIGANWLVGILLVGLTGVVFILGDFFYLQRSIEVFCRDAGGYLITTLVSGLILSRKLS